MSKESESNYRQSNSVLRICVYSRYSAADQDETSITDQIAFSKRTLEASGIDLSKATIDLITEHETQS